MSRRRTRVSTGLFAISLLFVVAGFLPLFPPQARAQAPADDGSVTKTVTATRSFVDQDGTETEVDERDVSLTVSQTQDLRGRQEIHVSWQGAAPTGGVVGDPNSSDARNQEYPFVLLQCRGVDTTGAVPRGQVRLSPESCWTQTSTERYLAAASHTPSWRFDAYATAADRGPVVGAPDPLPPECAQVSEPLTARWLPFRAAGGRVFYGGPDPNVGCTSLAPESDSAEAGGLPSNTTYGITGPDGKGETDFAVWTAGENASLGCSATVSCALVAVPIVGVSCDAYGTRLAAPQTTKTGVPLSTSQQATADATCRRTGAYSPGEPRSSTTTDQAVRGNLWWTASNWRNRISVPLGFAETGSVCDAVSAEAPEEVMGSVVLNELTASWRPEFCTNDSLFTFTHVQQADSLARSLVDLGEVDAAFSTAPQQGGYHKPVVQAPAALGGFAIAFNIDGADKQRRTELKLNARLVAKLLTSSYPAMAVMRDNHPSIGGNPLNITLDPEFQALNPGLPATTNLESAAALQVFSSSTDLMWALTSWLEADPEARAWLNGYADPWGMTVNETYRGVVLPVDNWPLNDDFVAPQWYQDQNACYGHSPTPFMQLIANPANNLGSVLLNMQYSNSAVQTVCKYDGYDATTYPLRQQGRQTVGYRFVLGLVSVSAAERYNLRTAELQTRSTASPGRAFGDASGRTFVAPDADGLRAAVGLMQADTQAGTWVLDYGALSTEDGADAYPGAMPVYLVAPSEGLDETTATRLAKLLCYAGGAGQEAGDANGELPAGYLPMTEKNGFGDLLTYQGWAIAAVRLQAGLVPRLDAPPSDHDLVCDFSRPADPPPTAPEPTDGPAPGGSGGPGAGIPPIPDVAAPGAPTPASDKGGATPPADAAPDVVEAETSLTSGETSLFGRMGVPGLLVLALGTALAGVLVRWYELIAAGVTTAARRAQQGRVGRSRSSGGRPS